MNKEYIFLIAKLNTESTPKVNIANIKVETATIIVEFCNSFPFGHSTFSLNSKKECFIKLINELIINHSYF